MACKITLEEMKIRKIGQFADPDGSQESQDLCKLKRDAYVKCDCDTEFLSLRQSLKEILKNHADYPVTADLYLVNKIAQLIMDSWISKSVMQRAGKPPAKVVLETATGAKKAIESVDMIDGSLFKDKKPISENEMLRWCFDNVQKGDLRPEESPSLGAWTLLQQLRERPDFLKDFYKSVWPKLLQKEDAEKGAKLEDDGKETIKLCGTLLKALETK